MAQISAKRGIPCAARQVFQAAKDVERFPSVMPDLNKVTILEDDGKGNTITSWEGTVAVGPLKRKISWTEKDNWDDEGSEAYSKETFSLAINFAIKYSKAIWEEKFVLIDAPKILPGPDGRIDV